MIAQWEIIEVSYMYEGDISPLRDEGRVLTEAARLLYLRLLSGERTTSEVSALSELAEIGLVSPTATGEVGSYTPIAPRHAERVLRARALAGLAESVEYLRNLPQFIGDLENTLRGLQAAAGAAVPDHDEVLEGPQIDVAIEEIMYDAKHEICTAQPGARPDNLMPSPDSRDFAAMRRGVHFRTVYSTAARYTRGGASFARRAAEFGSEVRTSHVPFARCIIFDDSVAVVPALVARTPDDQPRAWIVRNAAGLEFCRHVFSLTWDYAQPWSLQRAQVDGTISTPRQREILHGLMAGGSQAEVATALNISANWVSQQLNLLREKLGLSNREQLIGWWLESDERHIAD